MHGIAREEKHAVAMHAATLVVGGGGDGGGEGGAATSRNQVSMRGERLRMPPLIATMKRFFPANTEPTLFGRISWCL
jgi:hypothetical protein